MKVIKSVTQEEKDALKFVLEEVNPNDQYAHITVKDLRQIDKLCKIIDDSKEEVSLEDTDFDYLKGKFLGYSSWNPKARDIVISVDSKMSEASR